MSDKQAWIVATINQVFNDLNEQWLAAELPAEQKCLALLVLTSARSGCLAELQEAKPAPEPEAEKTDEKRPTFDHGTKHPEICVRCGFYRHHHHGDDLLCPV